MLNAAQAVAAPDPTESLKAPQTDAGAPSLTFSPASVNFGRITNTHTSQPMTVTLTNSGDVTLDIRFLGVEGPSRGSFGIVTNTCRAVLQSGSGCTVAVVFVASGGEQRAFIYVTGNASNSPQNVPLYGRGIR